MTSPRSVADVFADLPEVETERLLLRKLTLDDTADVYHYTSDPGVTHFTSWDPHQSVDDSRHFLEDVIAGYELGEVRSWGVIHKVDRRCIGTAGFLFWDLRANRAEIGYAMSRDYWGQGLMTEAVLAIVRFGFERMGLNRIEARCDGLNVGSIRVLEKAGMTHEGTLRQQFVVDGEFRDLRLYAILRRDWSGT